MMSGIWAKAVGVLVMIIGMMGAALLLVSGQKDRAKEAARRARAEAKSKSAVIDAERAIDTARAQAREKSQGVQREAENRPADKRPDGDFRR